MPVRLKPLLILLAVLAALPAVGLAQNEKNEDRIPDDAVEVHLVDVIDGDTFDVDFDLGGGRDIDRVRMIGIDTPETNYSFGNEPECYGKEATRKAESLLVAAEEIWLETDKRNLDPNGRLLRYVWVLSEIDGKVHLLNEQLVQEGYALAKTYQPNVKYQDRLDAAERKAITASAGMWLSCDASVSADPDLEDPETGPDDVPIDRTTTPIAVDEEAACSFFNTFDEAQDFLDLFPELADSLDPDGNGVACEDYFGVGDR